MEFWDMFKTRKADILRLVDAAQSGCEIRQARVELYSLQKTFNDAVDLLPSFDQKSYSTQLVQIASILNEKEAAVAPKPKFSFKDKARARQAASVTTASAGSAGNASIGPAKTTLDQHLHPHNHESALAATDIHHTLHIINAHQGGLTVDRVSDSVLVAPADTHSPSSCHIHNVERSIINLIRVDGSLFLNNINHAIIIAECHQFRIHKSHNVTIALSISSTAIMESCTNITFVKHPKATNIPVVSDFDDPVSSSNFTCSENTGRVEDIVKQPTLAQLAYLP
ncbi:hypothetical protein E3P92_03450 [Wallemia ichthyophaga]|nr:hypothetical protein E3P98_00147 [Wallemia ichthyophaga]TIB09483.1 hypothetical protein E3P92_03450 [Wallemia ichthyophaga]